jgi:hypothetical protein
MLTASIPVLHFKLDTSLSPVIRLFGYSCPVIRVPGYSVIRGFPVIRLFRARRHPETVVCRRFILAGDK